jgi:ATP/ADP translocase
MSPVRHFSKALTASHSLQTTLRGGAASALMEPKNDFLALATSKLCGSSITPEGRAVLSMALAMAIHFAGYEFARNTSLSLFTSNKIGFGSSSSSISFAMACVTPFSMLLLMWYGQELENHGPRVALKNTTIFCTLAIVTAGLSIHVMEQTNTGFAPLNWRQSHRPWLAGVQIVPVKIIVWLMYLIQNSYAHLVYQQHWSFIGSVLTPAQGAKWFASITGVTSIASTIAAGVVSKLALRMPLPLLFGFGTGIALTISSILSDRAYIIAMRHDFSPHKEKTRKESASEAKGDKDKRTPRTSLTAKASQLFKRVPTLKFLFYEVVSFMGLATMQNLCLVKSLKLAVPCDAERTVWTSHFWAWVNGLSGCLQFFVLPTLFRIVEPRRVFPCLPLIIFVSTVYQSIQSDPNLKLISGVFLLVKVMDYALRGVIGELVYVSLDFESRYVGKEVIGVFGNRLGKSGMSLALSAITAVYGDLDLQAMSCLASLASFAWLTTGIQLSSSIPRATKSNHMNSVKKKTK